MRTTPTPHTPHKERIFVWGNKKIIMYTPQRNKIRLGLIIGFLLLLIITPFTNWLSIPLFKIINKFPMWLYR